MHCTLSCGVERLAQHATLDLVLGELVDLVPGAEALKDVSQALGTCAHQGSSPHHLHGRQEFKGSSCWRGRRILNLASGQQILDVIARRSLRSALIDGPRHEEFGAHHERSREGLR